MTDDELMTLVHERMRAANQALLAELKGRIGGKDGTRALLAMTSELMSQAVWLAKAAGGDRFAAAMMEHIADRLLDGEDRAS